MSKGGGVVAAPHFCFFLLTFLHLTLWRPISNLPAYKSKRYKTVVKVFFQGGHSRNLGGGGLQQPPSRRGGGGKENHFFLGLG